MQIAGLGRDGLGAREQRALDYFHGRVWPLLQTSEEPCAPPLPVAIQHRVVLLATCVLADSHRLLQDGKDHDGSLNTKRLECLTAIRSEVDGCCAQGNNSTGLPHVLLFAVLLLHLHDGFMELAGHVASTSSHHKGVLAILGQLGGLEPVLRTSQESLQMLLSEFVSADLTSALLQGIAPSYPPAAWHVIDQGAVWWGRDPLGRYSLAFVLREMSAMAFYHDSLVNGQSSLCMDEVHSFEEAFRPVYAPVAMPMPDSPSEPEAGPLQCLSERDIEAVHAFALIRTFQHTALIFLYRAICGLPTLHPLVQQHVRSCLDCIMEIERSSKLLHCVIFPLCVAGAHAQSPDSQHEVLSMTNMIYDNMRFASVKAVSQVLTSIWTTQSSLDLTWTELFAQLSPHVLVL
ncbi:unnamed protein product [Clonostachys chloroleuca]|uniref:Uncharacterized protein n=2 Tax=Clonostachys TaxID=110564 RepID=A0AA35M0N5_9HYPO|nr:unnamed protein product [Clonostachys chloroleuca]